MRIEDLERELRAERPELDPEFARKLDEWAAAGFPRGGELDQRARGRGGTGLLGRVGDSLRRARERISSVPPRRLLAPAGAAATLIVVGAVVVSQTGDSDQLSSDGGDAIEFPAPDNGGGAGVSAEEAPAAAAPEADVRDEALALPEA